MRRGEARGCVAVLIRARYHTNSRGEYSGPGIEP
jgi:hypothetical protein